MYSSLFQQLLCWILDSTEKPNLDQKGLGLIVTVWFGLDIVGIVRHLADPYTTQSLENCLICEESHNMLHVALNLL